MASELVYSMKIRPVILGLLLLAAVQPLMAAERFYQVTAAEWARPRQGDLLVTYPGLKDAIQEWNQSNAGRIQIRYPGGEEGVLWAEELRDWLVALGVPSTQSETVPGSRDADSVDLVFIVREDMQP